MSLMTEREKRAEVSVSPGEKHAEAGVLLGILSASYGVSHFILGSVTDKVVRESSCPVLTVRIKAAHELAEELKRPAA
jgi:Universal stress protein family